MTPAALRDVLAAIPRPTSPPRPTSFGAMHASARFLDFDAAEASLEVDA